MSDRPLFRLELEAHHREGLPPPAILFRLFLKRAWRSWGLKCTRILELPPEGAEASVVDLDLAEDLVRDVLVELALAGVCIRYEDDKLFAAPPSRVTPELAERIRAHRGELVELLEARPRPARPPEPFSRKES